MTSGIAKKAAFGISDTVKVPILPPNFKDLPGCFIVIVVTFLFALAEVFANFLKNILNPYADIVL